MSNSSKSFLASCIFLFPLVAAQNPLETTLTSTKDFFVNILSFLFSSREIATKTLMGILLFMVLYTTADLVFKKKWIFTSLPV
jgi:hypothetical protein